MTATTLSDHETSTLEIILFGTTLLILRDRLEYDQRLGTLWKAIEAGFSDTDFHLEVASKACGMSKNNLNNLLRKVTGKHTFYSLLTAYRIYQSCLAALASNESFTQIALACGFDNSSSFSRAAKRLLKVPPTEFLPRNGYHRRYIRVPEGISAGVEEL